MLGYAVVDVETTGLVPSLHHRVVEIAIVRLDRDLNVTDEWTTLVNPQRDIGARSVHGISALQVADAPTFAEIAGDVLFRLARMVVVGHNIAFDTGFLQAEFGRCGWDVPGWQGLCTLELATIIGSGGGRSLEACCRAANIPHEQAHTAIGDARATAGLIRYYLKSMAPDDVVELLPAPVMAATFPNVKPSGITRTRDEVPAVDHGSSLDALVHQLPAIVPSADGQPADLLGYVDLLDRVVEDRSVTDQERLALETFARGHNLTSGSVVDIHRSYITSLVAVALRDQRLTNVERDDLTRVASVLGIDEFLQQLLVAADAPAVRSALKCLQEVAHRSSAALPPIDRRHELAGKSVCFTGESVCGYDREQQDLLAAAAGLLPSQNVTKRLGILVLADPASQSGKARKAVEYGTRRIAERAFWLALGVTVG